MKNKNFVWISLLLPILNLDKAPRAKSKKLRRYSDIDVNKEFEIRHQKREKEKKEKLEELYKKHD